MEDSHGWEQIGLLKQANSERSSVVAPRTYRNGIRGNCGARPRSDPVAPFPRRPETTTVRYVRN